MTHGADRVRIIGIDPGTLATGYGILDREGPRVAFVACGCVRSKPARTLPERFLGIYRGLCGVFDEYRPGQMAVEGIFFCRNAGTALKLGEARGIAMLVAAERGVGVFEYAPRRVKQAVHGSGGAGKAQVQYMIRAYLGMEKAPRPADAADALAVALCHAFASPGGERRAPRGERPATVLRPLRARVKG